jgi:hypothetical protein
MYNFKTGTKGGKKRRKKKKKKEKKLNYEP